jgi:hypothetical protein
VLCCVVLCCVLLCAVLCCAVLRCALLCCAVLCCVVLCRAVLCCAVLCCAVRCCAVLCCAVLCFAVLCWAWGWGAGGLGGGGLGGGGLGRWELARQPAVVGSKHRRLFADQLVRDLVVTIASGDMSSACGVASWVLVGNRVACCREVVCVALDDARLGKWRLRLLAVLLPEIGRWCCPQASRGDAKPQSF